jgi:hypothetical protein
VSSFEEVVDWVEGRLGLERAEEAARAVAGNPELAAAAAWVRTFHATAADSPLLTPPPRVREELRRRLALYRPPPNPLEPVRALLAFDSATSGLAGVRGPGAADGRQLVFQAPGLDVALDVYDVDEGRRRLAGQLLPEQQDADADGTVRLLQPGSVAAAARAQRDGSFELPVVAAGAYLLDVRWGGSPVTAEVDMT